MVYDRGCVVSMPQYNSPTAEYGFGAAAVACWRGHVLFRTRQQCESHRCWGQIALVKKWLLWMPCVAVAYLLLTGVDLRPGLPASRAARHRRPKVTALGERADAWDVRLALCDAHDDRPGNG